jgi:hypothetical protein
MNNQFKSQAEEIRHYAKELLNKGGMYSVKEIKAHVSEKSNKHFSDGAYAGSLRDLIANSADYYSPSRGMYAQVNKNSNSGMSSFEQQLLFALNETKEKLINSASSINPLNTTPHEDEYLSDLKEILNKIENLISKIN